MGTEKIKGGNDTVQDESAGAFQAPAVEHVWLAGRLVLLAHDVITASATL